MGNIIFYSIFLQLALRSFRKTTIILLLIKHFSSDMDKFRYNSDIAGISII